jgi:hypothetical protein
LIYNKKIEIGDTYFYRDIIHPKYIVERSILCDNDELVGSGILTHINDFIRILYDKMSMNYNDYVTENFDINLKVKRKTFWKECDINDIYNYEKIIEETINEIRTIKNTIG